MWRRLFTIATALTVPVFLLTVVFPMLPATRAALHHNFLGFALTPLLKWAFTTPVQVRHSKYKHLQQHLPAAACMSFCFTLASGGDSLPKVGLFVQFWVAWRFHVGAYKSLRRGKANMDVLVSLGTNASYIFSVITLICDRQHQVQLPLHAVLHWQSLCRPTHCIIEQSQVRRFHSWALDAAGGRGGDGL